MKATASVETYRDGALSHCAHKHSAQTDVQYIQVNIHKTIYKCYIWCSCKAIVFNIESRTLFII